jgi:hypothetical protein
MSNPNLTELDYNQALKRCINSEEDAMRVELATPTGMSIELSAADGDNVLALPQVAHTNQTVNSSSSGELARHSMDQSTEVQIMASITSAITGTCSVEIEVNPHPSGEIWVPTGVILNITGSANIKSAKVSDICFKARARVVSNTISVGSAVVYIVVRS